MTPCATCGGTGKDITSNVYASLQSPCPDCSGRMSDSHNQMNAQMNAERIAQIRARLENATPRPWHAGREADELAGDPDDPWVVFGWSFWVDIASNNAKADSALIAHAPDDLAFLLDLVAQGSAPPRDAA